MNTSVPAEIRCFSTCDDIVVFGYAFHGLQDVEAHLEMSLYRDWSYGPARTEEPDKSGPVHVGVLWEPYPCFDAEDYASENRYYQNYIFRDRPITQEDMKALSELPLTGINHYRLAEMFPADMLPLLYYKGDGDIIELATRKEEPSLP